MKINGVKNIIFDLDGTLIDSSVGVAEATNYALRNMGEEERLIDEIRQYIGYPLETMFADFSELPYDRFWELFRKRAKEVIVDSAVALDGADTTLRRLHRDGYKMAIGSTKIGPHIEGTIKKMGWDQLFTGFVGADMVANVKPAPDVFLKALKLLGGEAENTIVVGDTVNDILAAKSAGLRNIAVKSPYGRADELENSAPDHLIATISEIIDIIGI